MEAHQYGTGREDFVQRVPKAILIRGSMSEISVPTAVSQRLCLPELWLHGVLPCIPSWPVPVQAVPEADFCYGWNRNAPYHLSLVLWFWAIYLCINDKRGISAAHLSNLLGIGYESAWYMLKRIRNAMGQRDANYLLSGLMKMDEGFFGSKRLGGKRGRGTTQKKVVVALSKTGEKEYPMYIRMQQIPDVKRVTLQEFVDSCVKDGSVVECDGFRSYLGLENETVDTKVYNSANGDLHWLHTALSNVKAFLVGTYHGRCLNLQAYLDEFCFRFNRRHFGTQLFARLVRAVAVSSVAD